MLCSLFCAGKDGDVVSITLPPSQHTQTVTVTKGQTSNHIHVTENASSANTISSFYSVPPTQAQNTKRTSLLVASAKVDVGGPAASSGGDSAVDVSTVDCALGTLDLGKPDTASMPDLPSHLREQPLYDRFRVSKNVLKEYPAFHVGWKKPSWVIVIHGRDIGIFFSIFGMCSKWYNRSNSHCHYDFAACRSFTPPGAFISIILSLLRIITELPSPAVSCRNLGETEDPSMFLPSGSPANYPFMFIGGQFISNQDIVDATGTFGCMMLSPDHTLEKLVVMTMSASELRFLAAFGMVDRVRITLPFGSHMTHLPP
jgi:hypothetical protein